MEKKGGIKFSPKRESYISECSDRVRVDGDAV
jgi:hypothetical protein